MDPLVLAAATALVTAMATDSWQQARTAMVALWRRFRPDQADTVDMELAQLRSRMLEARASHDSDTERSLAETWQSRMEQLVQQDPEFAAGLRLVLDESLNSAPAEGDQQRVGSIVMNATAHDQGRVYQSARDMHIDES